MSRESLERLGELLDEAFELAPEDRGPFLDRVCGDDPDLRREVEELLGLQGVAAGYFDGLSSDIASTSALEIENAAQPRIRIGPYRTLAAIGQGGMGAVYLAERVDGTFDQQVALKLLHRDMDTPQLRARFLAERQLLARLSHPNIAHLLDGGVTDEGRPYFVMEHVQGQPITHYCSEHDLPVDKVLRLYLDVIEAVSYLHRNLVVHRDLKPSNIFIDCEGQVKLLDFGIAKLLAGAPDQDGLTRTREALMTPEYAAPEQLVGAPVTTATDVYALGVVLYELLTGRRPHDRAALDRQPLSRELPPTPSSALRSQRKRGSPTSSGCSADEPSSGVTVAWQRIAGDLDTICLAALRPETDARYPSAEQLGQDIERYLEGLPIRARRSTLGYRVGKFVQRHRPGVLATAGLLVALAAGFAHERGLRSEAERQAAKAVAVSDFLVELLSSSDPVSAHGKEVTVAEVLAQAAGRIEDSPELEEQPSVEAAVRVTIGITYTSMGKYSDAREHLERANELLDDLHSRDSYAQTAAAKLGVVYHMLGMYDEAESILSRVVELRIETLGEDHHHVLTNMTTLADLYWDQGRYEEVEAIDRRTLEIRRRTLGDDHQDTIKSLNGLAGTLFARGRYAQAAEFYEQALAAARRELGESHPHSLTLANNLAATHTELCRYPEAEALMREVVSAKTKVLGETHPETAMSMHNLGALLAVQARYEEAEEQLQQAITIREGYPGKEKVMLGSKSHLAGVYRDRGRLEDSEELYLSTLEQQRELYGPEDPATLRTIGGLAELRLAQGDPRAAEALLVEILDLQARVHGDSHPETLGSQTLLARIRNQQGRFSEAIELSERAIETGSLALGADHLVVLGAVYEQARALAGLGQPGPARELAERVHEVRQRLLGDEHPRTVEARSLLSNLGQENGDPVEVSVETGPPAGES